MTQCSVLYNIIIYGKPFTGKSYLLDQIKNYPEIETMQKDKKYIGTIGVDFRIKRYIYKQYNLNIQTNIWDLSGNQ